jgi:biotin transport system substrate-specific component
MQLRSMVVSALFAAIIAVLAQVSVPIPFSPVPITGQTLGVFLTGAILGGRLGAVSLVVYLLLGAIGIPVFAQGRGGLPVIAGPSGGFLLGFVLGVYLLGKIVETAPRVTYWRLVVGMALCMVTYYLVGTVQLALVAQLTPSKALMLGVVPFLPLDLVKLFVGASLALAVRRALHQAGLVPGT